LHYFKIGEFENVFRKFEIEKEKKECPLLSFRLLGVWAAIPQPSCLH
jgi:hypothetical protein